MNIDTETLVRLIKSMPLAEAVTLLQDTLDRATAVPAKVRQPFHRACSNCHSTTHQDYWRDLGPGYAGCPVCHLRQHI